MELSEKILGQNYLYENANGYNFKFDYGMDITMLDLLTFYAVIY